MTIVSVCLEIGRSVEVQGKPGIEIGGSLGRTIVLVTLENDRLVVSED